MAENSVCSCVLSETTLLGRPTGRPFLLWGGCYPARKLCNTGTMPPPLMLSRRFAPLFWCQFFAAFNDNFLKTSLVFLILFRSGAAGAEGLVTLASAIFIAPFFFLFALGGGLPDPHDKAQVAEGLKFLEIFVAALAVLGFARQSVPILFGALAGFGMIGALFGPIKYGILPDHLPRAELPP